MDASTLFKEGKLAEAIEAQIQEVKAKPADQGKRLFLYELLAFNGELDRARRQIDALKLDQPELAATGQAYRQLLDSEEARRRLFRDGVPPQFLADPPPHVAKRLQAVNCLRSGQSAEAAALLQEAASLSPTLKGQLNGKPFTALRDCDDLFSGVLEVMAQGGYYWVPFEQLESLAMRAPRFPRDLLWVPARLDTADSSGEVFLPALYPGSHTHADAQIRLGRATDWPSAEGAPVLGQGQRLYLVDEDPVSLLEWRELILEEPV